MKKILQRDFSRRWYLFILAALFVLRVLLASPQDIFILPDASSMDDALMFRAAQTVTAGAWMGPYSWVAAGKHMFFAVWLAFLHALHIPYVAGGQLLYTLAALAALAAAAPLLKKNWARLLVFCAVAFSPVSWASFTLRVYRDNIFPALCLFFFAGMLGFMLRRGQPVKKGLPWALLGGLGLGLAWLTREDGAWLLPFAGAAAAFYLLVVLRTDEKKRQKLWRALLCAVPFAGLAACICLYSFVNLQFYGRFMVSDFTSKEFNDAYGALTRIHTGEPVLRVPVTYQDRLSLYAVCPEAAELGETLDNGSYYNGFGDAESRQFNAGGFYWALRRAVNDMGYYRDAQTAKTYYEQLAAAVNKVCDDGLIPGCGPKRSGTVTPFHPSYLTPTLQEMGRSFKMLLLFEDTAPYMDEMSSGKPTVQQEWEDYLYTGCTRVAAEGADTPYRNWFQSLCAGALQAVTWGMRILIWPALFLAFWQLGRDAKQVFQSWRRREKAAGLLPAVLQLGLLLCVVLRVAMISYVEVSSFGIGTYLMYLSSAAPPLLLFAGLGSAGWLQRLAEKA